MLFFFDTFTGQSVVTDHEGRDLPGLADARSEAIEDAKEMIANAVF